jgi:hypothetical protein
MGKVNACRCRARAWSTLIAIAALTGCGMLPQGTIPAPPPGSQAPQPGFPPPQAAAPAPSPPTVPQRPLPVAPTPAPAPAAPSRLQAAKADLTDGVALYDAGDFNAAINKLGNSPEIAAAGPDIRVPALKYLAFSFCVTKRPVQCRTQFENAFKLDPAFDLTTGERGHPLWGPVFERAKKAQQAASR